MLHRHLTVCLTWLALTSIVQAVEIDEDDDPSRPSAIETINVPVTSMQVFSDLLPYQSAREAEFAGWAPDGSGILIRTRFGNAAQLHRVFRPGGRREQVTFFSEPAQGQFVPHGDDGDLIVSMSRTGNEQHQLYFLEPNAFRVTLLTDGRSRHTLGPISSDGRRMTVRSNQRNRRDMDIYVADIQGRKSATLLHRVTDEYWYASDWSHDDKELLMERYESVVRSDPAIFDFTRNRLEMLPTAVDGKAFHSNLRFAPNGRAIYMTSDAFSEFRELVRFDRDTKQYARLTSDIPWNVDDVAIDSRTGTFAFTVNQAGTSRLFVLEGGETRREIGLPGPCVVHDLRFSPDGTQLGLTLYSATTPGDVYSMGMADGKLTRWTYSVVGGLNPESFVEPRVVQYKSFDGRLVSAYYYRPHGANAKHPVPVVVSIHGGPESQYRPYFSPRTQYFVKRLQCAVICPNVRGSTGYGKTFVGLDDGIKREDSVRDIGALLEWIAAQPELDDQRVVVTGRSYGGYMVLASLMHFGDRLCAGIAAAGIANFTSFLQKTESYRQDRRRVEYGDERKEEMRQFFSRINPASNARTIRTDLLVIHGVHDPRVPIGEARQLVDRLRSLNRDVWAVFVGDEGHRFDKRTNADYIRAVEVMFLRRHLGLAATRRQKD